MTNSPQSQDELDEILGSYRIDLPGVCCDNPECDGYHPLQDKERIRVTEQTKQKLLAWRRTTSLDSGKALADKIQTLANDFDLPNITTWKQGRFIDKPAYNRSGADWKREQEERELTSIRPYGGTNNALFQISGTDRATDIAAYLEEIATLLIDLTKKNMEEL